MSGQTTLSPDTVLRAATGTRSARNEVLAALEPALRDFFRRRLGPRMEVDDLVQNTLLRVDRSLSSVRNPERIHAFARKAALFELNDYYRGRYHGREKLVELEEPPAASSPMLDPGLRDDIRRFLAALPETTRRVLSLREYGYRYAEIGEIVGSSESAVKMQVKRAFERLRKQFGPA